MPYIPIKKNKPNINTLEGLKTFAKSKGLNVEEKKEGLLRKGIDIISRPLYASAGFVKALIKKENPLEEAWKGLTGQEKETYSDVLRDVGVTNKWLKGGLGFALDIALDPSTYFGGTLLKGIAKTVGVAGKFGLEAGRKINPRSIAALEMAGTNLKDALGHAFVFGYKTSSGLSDDVSRFFNKIGIAKEEIIEQNFKTLNKFDDKTIREATNIMFENKRLERLARGGNKIKPYINTSGNVGSAVEEMKKIGQRIGKLTGLPEEQLYKNYIPSILNLRERMAKEAAKGLTITKEGYLKKFKDLLPDESLLKKPIEAYSRREFEVVRNNITKQTLNDIIKGYGKPLTYFKDKKEAILKGYRIIKDKKFGKELGYLKLNDFNFINNYMFPEMKTIDMLAKASGYDKLTNIFKSMVTAWFPSFHIRNYISGNVQNYSILGAEALNPVNHFNGLGFIKGTNKIISFPKWKGTGAEMNKILKENFRGASRYISDLGDYIEDLGTKGFMVKSNIQKLNPKQIGNFIEMNQKAVAISTALKQGKTIKEAIKLAEKAGFDYTKITKFESKIMRRTIPFYTFARKNAELQLKTISQNPQRILNQIKFTKNLSEIFGGGKPTEKDLKGLPEWALDSLGFKIKGSRFLTKFGLPLEEFVERVARPGKSSLSSLNPLIKYPLESKLGYDFFREKKIIDINKISPVTGKLILDKAPDLLKKIINVRKAKTDYGTKYYASPKALHILRNIPTARFQNTLESLFKDDKKSIDKWLAFLTGARIYDIDLELQQYFNERDLRRDLEDQLLQIGEGARFQRFYNPNKN